MLFEEVFEDGFGDVWGGDAVAEDAVVEPLADGVEDGSWGGEVHVGDPHGEDVAVFVAGPFEAAGGAAFGDPVEEREVVELHEGGNGMLEREGGERGMQDDFPLREGGGVRWLGGWKYMC